MRFTYLAALYGFSASHEHVAVPVGADEVLRRMAHEVVGTEDLVAIYIPQGTDEVYQPGNQRGRVVGAVRLVPMPPGRGIEDYFDNDVDGTRRWPVGWPCQVVYAPPTEGCPVLKSLVELVHGPRSFQPFVARFQYGPIKLDRGVADKLFARFAGFPLIPSNNESP